MELLNIGATEAILLMGLVSGVVELIKRVFDKDWRAAAIILGAGVAGVLAGFILDLGILVGAVAGFAVSGYITLAQNFGKTKFIQ